MPTLLLELFSEEIPSRMQRSGAEQLARLMTEGLKRRNVPFGAVSTYVSPRHLALEARDLPLTLPDTKEERRGPKIGAPEQALKGFLNSTGLALEQCAQRDGYYFATIEKKGGATTDILKTIVEEALGAFVWPKSMQWGAYEIRWVRPLHRITCLLDDTVIPARFGHLTASNVTEGHRFLAPSPITISHAEQYAALLESARVIVDFDRRRAMVGEAVNALAMKEKLTLIEDEGLLNEVTGLVEWPVPLMGMFENTFLDLPPEVLISEMKTHQRYFALKDANGKLANRFITVANMMNADGGKKVMEGNARVIRARLSDGEFYWNQDRAVKLEAWAEKLKDVVFHAKVGMMDKKVERIETLAVEIAKAVGFSDIQAVQRAAQLCKADLTSGMVGEFPELQGIMGRYYALAQGEKPGIADAIRDHYKPLGAGDTLPESDFAAIVAVADKLDSILSLFAAGEKPTGSKDPLALRRAALGVLRIVLEREWKLDLAVLSSPPPAGGRSGGGQTRSKADKITNAYESVPPPQPSPYGGGSEVITFFHDRLKQVLRDEGLRHDVIEASAHEHGASFVPLTIAAQSRRLNAWLGTEAGKTSLAAIKRVLNILAAEEKKGALDYALARQSAQGNEEAETAFRNALGVYSTPTLDTLEKMTPIVNHFFEKTLVNDPSFRLSRLALLETFRATALKIADFSKIEG